MIPSQTVLRRGFCIFLPEGKQKFMVLFVATFILVGFLLMAVFQKIRLTRCHAACDGRTRILPLLLLCDSLMLMSDIFAGGELEYRLPLDMFIASVPLLAMNSFVFKPEDSVKVAKSSSVAVLIYSLYCVACGCGLARHANAGIYMKIVGACSIYLCMQHAMCVFLRVREIRFVIKNGNVWSFLGLAVEGMYMSVFMSVSTILLMVCASQLLCLTVSVIIMLAVLAMCHRLSNDAVFVLWEEQERRIVESMKISNVEISVSNVRGDELYKGIYERVVDLFEKDKIYLNSDLTINDIVKIVFTNKLYISRAISRFTGRNFCQFVNYYRVSHSVRVFRDNPELKVAELAGLCGFNTVASFSMAFRLYMCESPSDWCRKERAKLTRQKK